MDEIRIMSDCKEYMGRSTGEVLGGLCRNRNVPHLTMVVGIVLDAFESNSLVSAVFPAYGRRGFYMYLDIVTSNPTGKSSNTNPEIY
ncbi:hypothetical protein J6590_057070 [Homalodisca vitripennis]|nr:hypothetical protein J6590_057070 [Homalodisca vitripennis]